MCAACRYEGVDHNPPPDTHRSIVRLRVAGVLVCVACIAGIRLFENRIVATIINECDVNRQSRHPTAEVLRAIRALKLITCEIDTQVRVDRGDENWRGVVRASVTTPVRMRYGVDLDRLDATTIAYSPISEARTGLIVLRVPYPELLATEVFSEREKIDVAAEGLRLRSVGGEYYLGLARRDVPEAARSLVLRPADEVRVRDITVNQIKELVSKIIGEDVLVVVRFAESMT